MVAMWQSAQLRIRHALPLPVRDALNFARSTPRRIRGDFVPRYPQKAGLGSISPALEFALGLRRDEVVRLFDLYSAFEENHRFRERFGSRETLTLEEGFITYATIRATQPQVVVEIGTQTGRSTRKILDMRTILDFDYEVECFDIYDGVEHFDKTEAHLHLKDITGSVRETVMERWESGVIFLDAHPRQLIEDVVEAVLQDNSMRWVLVMHDCGAGLCNPLMQDIPAGSITSLTGVWERHVLASKFGVTDPLSTRINCIVARGHRLAIVPTRHGFGLLTPTNPTREQMGGE